MTERKVYVYKQPTEGNPIEAAVFYNPRDPDADKPKPIAVYYHGGNFVVGHKDLIQPAYVNKLLELGFGAVVSPDYRLSPTISAFEGPVTDARDAYAWSQAELPAKLAQDVGVKLDADRIATWGHSAGGTLAMLVASSPKPPRAILNLFGMLYFQDESYHSPLKMPPVKIPDAEFRDQVYKDVPPPTSAPPPFGPKGPDMSTARGAWLFSHMADGTFLKNVQPDGDYNKIDPASLFVSSFPPTFFGHGSADMAVNVKLTEKAHQALQELGVDSKLEIVEGAGHGFDMGKKPGDKAYDTVIEGLQFLRDHV